MAVFTAIDGYRNFRQLLDVTEGFLPVIQAVRRADKVLGGCGFRDGLRYQRKLERE
jgi:hypothetical protein